ncbi:MAG: prepilin-type N-terminal cleavage/methylation domain-containing protein [Candidatus Omnitrophica bacterium]|nr:prepilin-type N-terminal cleavage/methylation domain-containing protein [Candidatus Omnitrophota bacterium]
MKEIFRINRKGITLIELLVVISLTSLIFALGLYPILTQIKLFGAERAEITLFDEANLTVDYITRDAIIASNCLLAAFLPPGGSGIAMRIVDDPNVLPRLSRDVYYSCYFAQPAQLTRSNQGVTTLITDKLDPDHPPVFTYLGNPPKNILAVELYFKDPAQPRITTSRKFEVMLRCRDRFRVP